MSAVDRSLPSSRRIALIGVALVALLFALTAGAALSPLESALSVVVERAGYDYVIAAVLGAMAVLAAVAVLASGRASAMSQTEMPAVERPIPVASAGEPFDETVAGWRFATRIFGGETGEEVRERLRGTAARTVAAEAGCSRQEARRRVEDGTWTDDPAAADFLAGEYTPLGTWLVALADGETGPERRARRTVEAIVALRDRPAADRDGLGTRESGPKDHEPDGDGPDGDGPDGDESNGHEPKDHGPNGLNREAMADE